MTDTDRTNPWDAEVDSGFGWTDQLVTQWDGKAVYLTRNISGPEEQREFWRLTFPDGSHLYIGTDGAKPILRAYDAGDIEHPFQFGDADATKATGACLRQLYDNASIRELDTDL